MTGRFWFALLAGLLASGLTTATAAEKIQIGTAVKVYPHYYLPILAGEEKGIWKEKGLEVGWVPFSGGAGLIRAEAARAINIGLIASITAVQASARGVPIVMVSELVRRDGFWLWVRTGSRLREPKDLKGARVGVPLLGGSAHAFGLAMTKALGLAKDVKFVGAGGSQESVAAMRAGAIDGSIAPFTIAAKLKAAGEVRELLNTADYLPKEWIEHVVLANTDFIKNSPETTRSVVRGLLLGIEFTLKNPSWSTEKMREQSGFSQETAKLVAEDLPTQFTRDGKISKKALENLRDFLMEYKLIPRDKAPSFEELFTPEFTR